MDEARLSELAQTGRTRDARGRTVRMIDPKRLYLLRRHDVIEREALNAIVDDAEPMARRSLRLAVFLLIPIVLLTVGGVLMNCALEGPAAWRDLLSTLKLMGPILLASTVGGVIAPWIAVRQQRMKRVRWAMLKHGHCPHCGYDLHGLPADDADGATVCPECACAWPLADTASGAPDTPFGLAGQARGVRIGLVLVMIGLTVSALLGVVFFLLR
jgi:hypothetical protein